MMRNRKTLVNIAKNCEKRTISSIAPVCSLGMTSSSDTSRKGGVHAVMTLSSSSQYKSLKYRRFCTTTEVHVLSDESEFHEIADETLEELIDSLSKLEDAFDDLEVDLSVSQPHSTAYLFVDLTGSNAYLLIS